MAQIDLKLLDCTLRDGGYVNDWNWGYQKARNIINSLVKANVDVVEVGFLRNVEGYNPDVTVCNKIEELNRLLPENKGNTMFSGMAMRSNYNIKKLSPYSGEGIEMIRITAHDYDIEDGMDFARDVKERGYKLSINPINIMGYSDDRILWIVDEVNKIQPYQFSIVDTFGSMKKRDLDRIVSLVDHNLDSNIRLALHLHENMAISCYLAQNYIDKRLNRPIAIDGSLMGMGRIPGNLPIELIADYLNDVTWKNYDIDFLLDAIQDYISPLKGETEWGYTPAYFLSARFNLHRNYAEHYLKKKDLTHRDINHILARFDKGKKTAFDSIYADKLYEDYKNNQIDDAEDWKKIKTEIQGKNVLVIAPGATLKSYGNQIKSFISLQKPLIISTNFIPDDIKVDYAFFSNGKRFNQAELGDIKTIVTSNIPDENVCYKINYNSISGAFTQGCNSLIMLLKMLRDCKAGSLFIAGADGYSQNSDNYVSNIFNDGTMHDNKFNLAVIEAIRNLGIHPHFITPSSYIL